MGKNKPPCWIVDVDGTLALLNGRNPFETVRLRDDLPNRPVIEVVQALAARGNTIIIVSGRQERSRAVTIAWLDDHSVPFAELYMRPNGDYSPDERIKEGILRRKIMPHYDVRGVIDDRNKVVKMWRRVGLTCLQVADGDF